MGIFIAVGTVAKTGLVADPGAAFMNSLTLVLHCFPFLGTGT
jgi:hypothetical protein